MTAGKSNGAAGRSGLPSVQGQGEITPKLLLRTLWHSLALATSVWGFQQLDYLEHLAEMDVSSQYGGHFQFLTICSLWATILTMCVALLQDLLEGLFGITRTSGTLGSVVGLVKTLMSVVTMPTETLVSILFWTLFAIDPTLVSRAPKSLLWSTSYVHKALTDHLNLFTCDSARPAHRA